MAIDQFAGVPIKALLQAARDDQEQRQDDDEPTRSATSQDTTAAGLGLTNLRSFGFAMRENIEVKSAICQLAPQKPLGPPHRPLIT